MVLVGIAGLVGGRSADGLGPRARAGLQLPELLVLEQGHPDGLPGQGARAGLPEAAQFSWLIDDVREMTERAGMPMPKVAIVPNEAPNAFATGRNPQNAVVAATVGLLRILDRRQVRAVLGHELAHVRNRDMLTMTLVAGAVSAIGMLAMMARWGAMFGGSRDQRGPNPSS